MKNLEKIENFLLKNGCQDVEFGWGHPESTYPGDFLAESPDEVNYTVRFDYEEPNHFVVFYVPIVENGEQVDRVGFVFNTAYWDEDEVKTFYIDDAAKQYYNDKKLAEDRAYYKQWKASGSTLKLKEWRLENKLDPNFDAKQEAIRAAKEEISFMERAKEIIAELTPEQIAAIKDYIAKHGDNAENGRRAFCRIVPYYGCNQNMPIWKNLLKIVKTQN